jgi:hypothetical protein
VITPAPTTGRSGRRTGTRVSRTIHMVMDVSSTERPCCPQALWTTRAPRETLGSSESIDPPTSATHSDTQAAIGRGRGHEAPARTGGRTIGWTSRTLEFQVTTRPTGRRPADRGGHDPRPRAGVEHPRRSSRPDVPPRPSIADAEPGPPASPTTGSLEMDRGAAVRPERCHPVVRAVRRDPTRRRRAPVAPAPSRTDASVPRIRRPR